MVVWSDPAEKGERTQHREDILGKELPQSDSEQDQPEHLRLLSGLGSGILSLLLLSLKQGCLTQAVPENHVSAIESHAKLLINLRCEPWELGVVNQELSRNCCKSVPGPHDAL